MNTQVQEIIDLLHMHLRTLCTQPITYVVDESLSVFTITVKIDQLRTQLTISKLALETAKTETWWDNLKYSAVRGTLLRWAEDHATTPADEPNVARK